MRKLTTISYKKGISKFTYENSTDEISAIMGNMLFQVKEGKAYLQAEPIENYFSNEKFPTKELPTIYFSNNTPKQ